MIDTVATAVVQPSPFQIWAPPVITAIASIIVGYLVYRNSQKANTTTERESLSGQQLAWTQQAMTEAQAAKADAKQALAAAALAESAARTATAAAEAATRRADAAEQRLRDVTAVTDSLMDWIQRVVRKAHAEDIGDGASPAVLELLRVINGGPPEITSDKLRRIRGDQWRP